MRHVIIGTAGHIDHGKTTLVKALTGIDTDRLKEEKRRGISIDLGFAHLDLAPGLRAGFVDVPGHERFVRNMLAGASGVDIVLLVVDALQSIQPQTREHFDICRLLDIRRGVIALTKIDLNPGDLVRLEIEEFVRGSFLEEAPVIPVSAMTGQGIPELKAELTEAALNTNLKDVSKLARLPIDRSFSMRGHGAVVTGTLTAGSVSMEDELELFPSAKRVRVRGIEVHGSRVERAQAGERTALNLAGIDSNEIQRGMTLAAAGCFRLTDIVDTMLELLPSAKPLKHRAPVHFHAATAEVIAETRLLESSGPMQPGSTAAVRFVLREPLLVVPGDRFIVRMFSPVSTCGGGVIANIIPQQSNKVRSKTKSAQRTLFLAHANPSERIQFLVAESPSGLSLAEAVALTGLKPDEIRNLHPVAHGWLVSTDWLNRQRAQIISALAEFHLAQPLQLGMTKEGLRATVIPDAPAFLFEDLIASPDIVVEGEKVRLHSHRVTLQAEEQTELERLEAVFRSAGMAVPSIADALAASRLDAARARTLLQALLKEAKVLRVNNELAIHAEAAQAIRSVLASRKGSRFSVADFKKWTGVSRKYAIPLLEWLDRQHLTRRDGDARLVL